MKGHKGRLKSYLEYKLDLELCGIDTFDKDDKIRERYANISKIKNRLLSNYQDNIQTKKIRSLLARTYWNLKRKRGGLGGRKVETP
jgi:hypothetical protein